MSLIPDLEKMAIFFPGKSRYKNSVSLGSPILYGKYDSTSEEMFTLDLENLKLGIDPEFIGLDLEKNKSEPTVTHHGCMAAYIMNKTTKKSMLQSQTQFIFDLAFEYLIKESET